MQPTDALEQFLHSIPLFELVGRDELVELLRLVRPVNLEVGEQLFKEGETGTAMWVLGPGCEVQLTAGGRPLASIGSGETLGEMALIDDAPRSATATVKSAGGAYRIEAIDFDVLRDQQRPCAFQLLRKMARDMCLRLRMTSVQIVPEGVGQPESPSSARPATDAGERLHASTLEEFAPLQGTPATARLALAQKLTQRRLQPGELVFREGQRSDAIYLLVEGEVETRRHGTPYVVLGAGSLFGLVSTLDGGDRSASVVARTPARVWRLALADFDFLFKAGHRFAFRLVELVARQLAANLRQANSTLVAHTAPPGETGLNVNSLGELDFKLEL